MSLLNANACSISAASQEKYVLLTYHVQHTSSHSSIHPKNIKEEEHKSSDDLTDTLTFTSQHQSDRSVCMCVCVCLANSKPESLWLMFKQRPIEHHIPQWAV